MLDIRIPIGLMFSGLGVILILFGLLSSPKIYVMHSLGFNINLAWGCVMLIFGGLMLFLSRRKRR